MNSVFSTLLTNELLISIHNNYKDNFDDKRFEKSKQNLRSKISSFIKERILLNRLISNQHTENYLLNTSSIFIDYGTTLKEVYNMLEDDNSKEWLIKLIAYKILGYTKVKLPSYSEEYFESYKKAALCFDNKSFISVNFLGKDKNLYLANLESIGYKIKLYAGDIVHQFIAQQYNYKNYIKVDEDDVVLDCGVCYGDTALYFADLAGNNGKVIGFEFIPSNIDALAINFNLNQHISDRINIVKMPLWDKPNIKVFYKDFGPGSKVSFENFETAEGSCITTTIDQTVLEQGLDKVDFIKMDIEGAEIPALEGAKNTILKFKPKLAIASYHSMDDFVNIPLWIKSLNVGYKIYIGHPTIHWEETVVFAIIE